MEASEYPENTRIKFHPLFHWISLAIGIIGIALAVVFYLDSVRERLPTFYVSPSRSIIVDRQLSIGDKLQVSYEGYPLKADRIAAVQCQFWNAGSEPIHGGSGNGNILKPIKIELSEGSEILDIKVIKQSRPEIVNFRVDPEKTLSGGRIGIADIHFDILEKDDGATIQIIFAGEPTTPIMFTGGIEGATIQPLKIPLIFCQTTT